MKPSSASFTALLPLLALGFLLDAPRQDWLALPGTWALVTIDGHALPYAPAHPDRPADAPPPPQVIGSTLTVNPDSTFAMSMSYRVTQQGKEEVVERKFDGKYAREGDGYRFTWTGAGQTPVTVRGDTLILNNEGMLFAYLRQPKQ